MPTASRSAKPSDQLVAAPHAEAAEIEDLKFRPAPRVQPGNALQGLQIVIKRRTDKNVDRQIVPAARLRPIVKPMDELLEA